MQQSTINPTQLELPGNLTVRFDLDRVTSDGGSPLVSLIDQHIGLTERIAALLPDDRDPRRITHSVFLICYVSGSTASSPGTRIPTMPVTFAAIPP